MATSNVQWSAIDHVQVAIPVGAEDRARDFYAGTLGLTEVPKPASMAARVEPGSRPATSASTSAPRTRSCRPARRTRR